MLTTTFTGNITFAEIVTHDGQGNTLDNPFLASDLASISSHWMNDEGDLIARKKPQFRVYVNMIERHGRKQPAPAAATVQAELAV